MNSDNTPHSKSTMRAADTDREAVVQKLAQAYSEGRLDYAEMDERTAAVWAAKTYGELAKITADLPATVSTQPAITPVPERPRMPLTWRILLPAIVLINLIAWIVGELAGSGHDGSGYPKVSGVIILLATLWIVGGSAGRRSRRAARSTREDWYHSYHNSSHRRFGG